MPKFIKVRMRFKIVVIGGTDYFNHPISRCFKIFCIKECESNRKCDIDRIYKGVRNRIKNEWLKTLNEHYKTVDKAREFVMRPYFHVVDLCPSKHGDPRIDVNKIGAEIEKDKTVYIIEGRGGEQFVGFRINQYTYCSDLYYIDEHPSYDDDKEAIILSFFQTYWVSGIWRSI